jgi:hypothetical protein
MTVETVDRVRWVLKMYDCERQQVTIDDLVKRVSALEKKVGI